MIGTFACDWPGMPATELPVGQKKEKTQLFSIILQILVHLFRYSTNPTFFLCLLFLQDALFRFIFHTCRGNSLDQSAGTLMFQRMGPVWGHEVSSNVGLGLLRKGHLMGQEGKSVFRPK